jgi:hypothetical protein
MLVVTYVTTFRPSLTVSEWKNNAFEKNSQQYARGQATQDENGPESFKGDRDNRSCTFGGQFAE